MQNSSYLVQLLYLLVYSSSLISAASVIAFRKRMTTEADKPLKQLLFAVAFCSTIFSIQVFINAVGLLEQLEEAAAYRTVLILNTSIIVSITIIVRAAILTSFILRPDLIAKKIGTAVTGIIAVILLISGILQVLTLFSHLQFASDLLGILMLTGTGIFSAGIIFSTIRLFLPLHLHSDPIIISSFRTMLLSLCIFPTFFIISGSLIGTILAPAGLIVLNILSIRIVYFRLKKQTLPEIDTLENSSKIKTFDPLSACREIGLSKRESEVALMLASGKTYKEIAAELFISMSTTQTHVGRIYSKLDINSKIELSNLIYYKKT